MRSSTLRTIGWAVALATALAIASFAYISIDEVDEGATPASPGPMLPDDPGDRCGDAAVTDPADLGLGRTLARCGAGAPAAEPLDREVRVRVAVGERTEAVAPLLVAHALGEFEAENLDVELVEIDDQRRAYAAMADGDVDVVVGGIDAPFFDAVHGGLDARLVLGGLLARQPGDVEEPQTGLWLRTELLSEDGDWLDVEGTTVLLAGGMDSAALYPIEQALGQEELTVNAVDYVPDTSASAAERLRGAAVGGAWLPEPAATSVAGDEALTQVATLPGSEAIDGTVFSPRLVGRDRAAGVAFARAIIRTINTHLADGYDDDAVAILADELGVAEDEITAGAPPLFDWELRSGTTTRIQDALTEIGAVGYERTRAESGLVDRSVYADAVGVDAGDD